MTTWEAIEEQDHRAFWGIGRRLSRLDSLEGQLLGEPSIVAASGTLSGRRNHNERGWLRDWRAKVTFMVGSLLAGALVSAGVSFVAGDRDPERVPAQFTNVAPEILRT